MRRMVLLVATRKGAWLYHSDAARESWRVDGPHFLGHVMNHVVLDPRDRRTLLAAAKTGHLGPTIFRSADRGARWQEAARPPAFAKAREGETGRAVDHTFWLAPGHVSQEGLWYAGTSPQGLFRSADAGATWEPFSGINEDARYRAWMGSVQDGTPDGPKLHSIIVDPRDAAHLYFAMSGGGVHESLDGGANFAPLVDGLEVVEGFDRSNIAFHDPHCVRLCPSNPDRLYQQNHCGIYRLDRPSKAWRRIGRSMPKQVGDIGFPMVLHPRDADTAWLVPAVKDECRIPVDGRVVVARTRDGGRRFEALRRGLPQEHAYDLVYRHGLDVDASGRRLVLGSTTGGLWISEDGGDGWSALPSRLPPIYQVRFA